MKPRPDREVYVHRSTDPWVKAGIARLLIDLFRRPLAAIFLVVMLALGLAMLVEPSWTAVACINGL